MTTSTTTDAPERTGAVTSFAVRRVSFAVHEVEPRPLAVETADGRESLLVCLRSGDNFCPQVLASSVDGCQLLQQHSQNSLLAAVHLAFSGHLPLILSPDMIWIAVLQGFARHVSIHAALLKSRLMRGRGKHVIEITLDQAQEVICWPELFDQFAKGLDAQVAGDMAGEMQCDFSTTGPVEKAASQVALMDVFSPYVQFVVRCICGIPGITLEGEVEDWQRLRQKLARLRGFEADDWIDELDLIAGQFVRASGGDVDVHWWRTIYKLHESYGQERVEGWLKSFFPYTKAADGTFTHRREAKEMIITDNVPPGLSDVAIKLVTHEGTESLRLVSGFVGVEHDEQFGVRPKIGWAVARSHFMELFVQSLDDHAFLTTRPSRIHEHEAISELPIDLQLFYRATDGADISGQGTLHPLAVVHGTEAVNHAWKHLGRWNDGSLIMANEAIARMRWMGTAWEIQVLALTFTDFIACLVAAKGEAYWQKADFVEPVIKPDWMGLRAPSPHDEVLDTVVAQLQKQNPRPRLTQLFRRDVFVLQPPATEVPENLPKPLQRLYRLTASLTQTDCFELWPADRVRPVGGTCERWLHIGTAKDQGLIFDQADSRGVALLDPATGKCVRLTETLKEFLTSAYNCPDEPFWHSASYLRIQKALFSSGELLWPDERIEPVPA